MNEPLPGTEPESPDTQQKPSAGPHGLRIDVLGASFSITAGEEPEYLNEVLRQYQLMVANTQSISRMKDPLKVAILTGFLLCDEINKLKKQFVKDQANAEAKRADDEQDFFMLTEDLITRLDFVMNEVQSLGDTSGENPR